MASRNMSFFLVFVIRTLKLHENLYNKVSIFSFICITLYSYMIGQHSYLVSVSDLYTEQQLVAARDAELITIVIWLVVWLILITNRALSVTYCFAFHMFRVTPSCEKTSSRWQKQTIFLCSYTERLTLVILLSHVKE